RREPDRASPWDRRCRNRDRQDSIRGATQGQRPSAALRPDRRKVFWMSAWDHSLAIKMRWCLPMATALFSDECRDDVIGDCLDLPSGQRRRMRIARRSAAQFLALEAIAVRVLIGVFVEVRHFGSRPTAGDDLDQLFAVKARLVQIGCPAGRAWIATPVA